MPDIHHRLNINSSIDEVHRLISTAAGLREWWADDVETSPDGRVTLGFFNRATIYRLHLLQDDGGRVAWRCETGKEWEGTDLIFTLERAQSGVLLDFVHANWRETTPYFVSCNTTWGGLMFRIRSAAEGKRPRPLFAKDSLGY
jgi:hypothetical protein